MNGYDFFNLLKDSKFNLPKSEVKQKRRFYLIKKIKNQAGEFSLIENLPDILFRDRQLFIKSKASFATTNNVLENYCLGKRFKKINIMFRG